MTTLIDIAQADGRFKLFCAALQASNLSEFLTDIGPYTLFIPLDSAFDDLGVEGMKTLMADTPFLARIVAHHLLPGAHTVGELLLLPTLMSVQGGILPIRMDDGDAYVVDSRIVMRDIQGDDGVMHAIDKLLTPPAAG